MIGAAVGAAFFMSGSTVGLILAIPAGIVTGLVVGALFGAGERRTRAKEQRAAKRQSEENWERATRLDLDTKDPRRELFQLFSKRWLPVVGDPMGEGSTADDSFLLEATKLKEVAGEPYASSSYEVFTKFLFAFMSRELYYEFEAVATKAGNPDYPAIIETFLDWAGEEWRNKTRSLVLHLPQRGFEPQEGDLLRDVEAADRKRRDQIFIKTLKSGPGISAKSLGQMPGPVFEKEIAKLFRVRGYAVTHTPATGDQGADLVLEKFGERTVVQCKRYAAPVGNSAVQEALAARAFYNANRAIVVTNAKFTPAAKALAARSHVKLVDGAALSVLLAGLEPKRKDVYDSSHPSASPKIVEAASVDWADLAFLDDTSR